MTTTTYVDANLHHDQVTGRAVTVCHILYLPLLLTGIPKDKLQLKLQLLNPNLLQPGLLWTKSLLSGTPSCILEFQSDHKAICLVTINLWLIVLVLPPLPYPRNQLWLPLIEYEKPLLQDTSVQLAGWIIQSCRHSEQTLGICKHLASPETSAFLEGRYKSAHCQDKWG